MNPGVTRSPAFDGSPTRSPADADATRVESTTIAGRIGLVLAALAFGCGTTIITPQPGYEWCVEVQNPAGSVSDPTDLNQLIVDPDTSMDPRGCLCFNSAEDQILQDGTEAELVGNPLPAGYEDLRDELVAAARLRCTELAVEREPPLMYTNCLSADVSLPYRVSDSATCTICIEVGVWSGNEKEVECPPGLEDGTGGASGSTAGGTSSSEATTMGGASLDETGTG
jgi:hypothetical protein